MEWLVAMYLLSDEYPLHFLDIGIEVGVMGGLIGCGHTPYMRQSFNSPHVLKGRKRSRRMLKKAVQQGRRRIEPGGVPSGVR